jgi:hypothetical protein
MPTRAQLSHEIDYISNLKIRSVLVRSRCRVPEEHDFGKQILG